MKKPEPIDIRTAAHEKPKGFLDQFRVFTRARNLAYATEKTYQLWPKRYTRLSKYQSPKGFKLQDIDSLYPSSLHQSLKSRIAFMEHTFLQVRGIRSPIDI